MVPNMAAPNSSRALWRGGISFGLLFIPIALHSAIVEVRPKMKLLDANMGAPPVGYKRFDKSTGDAVSRERIVKGAEVDLG